ncbi:hypothetical protein AA18889_1659 [Acetobacter senegalensis DSM 18889]|nr:hypothetical protein AA18889_1659 [Acetobacter senegalensis DSM 18889]
MIGRKSQPKSSGVSPTKAFAAITRQTGRAGYKIGTAYTVGNLWPTTRYCSLQRNRGRICRDILPRCRGRSLKLVTTMRNSNRQKWQRFPHR